MTAQTRIGTAGWAVPRASAEAFPAEGSVLERYAARFDAVEINSTFHRPHRPQTFERWAGATPPNFRFAVKAPRTITHERRLTACGDLLDRFLGETAHLGEKRGPILIQAPPSLVFDPQVARAFFAELRRRFDGDVVCEPRHASWLDAPAERMLDEHRIARVAADPAPHPGFERPGGWPGLRYWRWHGSPRMYSSAYGPERIPPLAKAVWNEDRAWVVFDNTMHGAATADALALKAALGLAVA